MILFYLSGFVCEKKCGCADRLRSAPKNETPSKMNAQCCIAKCNLHVLVNQT